MAFTSIPNEAIDRMTELSAGAWRLYCFLARCRNQTSGRCNPSVTTTAEAIDVHRKNVFKLRNELAAAGWARFDGDHATGLLGIGGSKNTTPDVPMIEDAGESSKNTTLRVVSSKNATISAPVVAKTLPLVAKTLPNGSKNATAYKEEQDERTRLIEQDELIHGAIAPVGSTSVLEVFAYWQSRLNHPQAKLTPERRRKIEARLKEKYSVEQIIAAIDGCASSPFHQGQNETGTVYDDLTLICRNGEKLESFISRSNGNGKTGIPRNETHNERAAREMEELFRYSIAAHSETNGDSGPDKPDAGQAWIAADYTRL